VGKTINNVLEIIKIFYLRLVYRTSPEKIRYPDDFEIRCAYERNKEAKHYKLEAAIGMLLRRFKIPIERSMTLTLLLTYIDGDLANKEDYKRVERLLRSTNYRRDVFIFMQEVGDITEQSLNKLYPVGKKRDELEKWLSGLYA